MTATPSRSAVRLARAVSAASASALVILTGWCVAWLLRSSPRTPEDALCTALVALSLPLVLRLAWSCVQAGLELRFVPQTAEPRTLNPSRTARQRPNASHRLAGWFLAFGTAIVGLATTAQASTPLTALYVTAESSSPQVPLPAFDQPAPLPSFAVANDRAATDIAPAEPSPPPEPQWTPRTDADERDRRLLVGPTASSGEAGNAGHVVLRGETLWSIAASHLPHHAEPEHVSRALTSWIAANPGLMASPDHLLAGDVLQIPSDAGVIR